METDVSGGSGPSELDYTRVAPAPAIGAASVEGEQASEALEANESANASTRRLLKSSAIISAGTLLGSVLGFVRASVLNTLFYGATGGASGAFVFALRPVQQINDLLVGGSVSGALIPTFVDYSAPEQRAELRRVYSTIANLLLLLLAAAALGLFFGAPYLVSFETNKFTPEARALTLTLVRIVSLSLFGLGLYAVTSGLLYALKEVVYPAFATSMYHLGVIVCGVAGLLFAAHTLGIAPRDLFGHSTAATVEQARYLGARGLAVGAAVGAACEFLLLLPGLRKAHIGWRLVIDLRHPAVRQIVRLYGPIAAGLIFTVLYQNLDLALTGDSVGGAAANLTALQTGTTLVQFPVGLVAAALSFAVLPPLTIAASRADMAEFKRTLRLGVRLGLLLMVPAAVGLIVLRQPIVALLFEHGSCGGACTLRNALALQNYAYELPFIAVDQLLIAAFYARKNTLIPNLVGVVSILFYIAVALPLHATVGLPALAFGDTAKNSGHAIVLFIILTFAIGNLGLRELWSGVWRISVAAAALGALCWAGVTYLPMLAPSVFGASILGRALLLLVTGALSAAIYFVVVGLLRVEEASMLGGLIRSRLGGKHAA